MYQSYTKSNHKSRNINKAEVYDFADILDTMTDTPNDIRTTKFNEIYRIALDTEDKKLLRFLDLCVIKFEDKLDSSLLEIDHG